MVASENDHDDAANDNVAIDRTRKMGLSNWTILFDGGKDG